MAAGRSSKLWGAMLRFHEEWLETLLPVAPQYPPCVARRSLSEAGARRYWPEYYALLPWRPDNFSKPERKNGTLSPASALTTGPAATAPRPLASRWSSPGAWATLTPAESWRTRHFHSERSSQEFFQLAELLLRQDFLHLRAGLSSELLHLGPHLLPLLRPRTGLEGLPHLLINSVSQSLYLLHLLLGQAQSRRHILPQ